MRKRDYSLSVGKIFGSWTIMSVINGKRARYEAQCSCGTISSVDAQSILLGYSQRCNACANPRRGSIVHGATRKRSYSPEWSSWRAMIERCSNPGHIAYWRYGGRGIIVSPEWTGRAGFSTFLEYIGQKPTVKHTIDRIDNSRGYEPGNVRWATMREQRMNQDRMRGSNVVELCDARIEIG